MSCLMEMDGKRVFAQLGFTGIISYCVRALSFSESQASYFNSVIQKSKEVPELKAAIDQGVINLSKARRIVPVITKETHAQWIEMAATLPQRELEAHVRGVDPREVRERLKPVSIDRHELKMGISDSTKEKWQRA